MKKMMLVLSLLCLAEAHAWSPSYVTLKSGKTTLFDVANQKNDLSLEWKVKSKNGFVKPEAIVLQEDGDFSCSIDREILLTSDYNVTNLEWTQAWEIKIHWEPGTDISGCIIQVTHPNEQDAKIKLYMNY